MAKHDERQGPKKPPPSIPVPVKTPGGPAHDPSKIPAQGPKKQAPPPPPPQPRS